MIETFLSLLLILLATNGAPILAARVFRSHADLAVDLGRQLPDGQPLFGPSKTWRGVLAAVFTAFVLSFLLGYGGRLGVVFGLLAMVGDLLSSFVKRRMGIKSSDQCIGLDQLPESIIPSLYAAGILGFEWWWALLLGLVFALVELVISKPLYWLKVRKRPY